MLEKLDWSLCKLQLKGTEMVWKRRGREVIEEARKVDLHMGNHSSDIMHAPPCPSAFNLKLDPPHVGCYTLSIILNLISRA